METYLHNSIGVSLINLIIFTNKIVESFNEFRLRLYNYMVCMCTKSYLDYIILIDSISNIFIIIIIFTN